MKNSTLPEMIKNLEDPVIMLLLKDHVQPVKSVRMSNKQEAYQWMALPSEDALMFALSTKDRPRWNGPYDSFLKMFDEIWQLNYEGKKMTNEKMAQGLVAVAVTLR